MPDASKGENAGDPSSSELERLKIENLLLKQKDDFGLRFREHVESVEKQMTTGKLKLGAAGIVFMIIAWFGTYQKIENQMENKTRERLDREFGAEEIKSMIRQSAKTAAREMIQKELLDSSGTEQNKLKCMVNKQGKDLFALQCHAASGQIDESRGGVVCVEAKGGENYYEPAFSRIDCEKILETNPTSSNPESSHR